MFTFFNYTLSPTLRLSHSFFLTHTCTFQLHHILCSHFICRSLLLQFLLPFFHGLFLKMFSESVVTPHFDLFSGFQSRTCLWSPPHPLLCLAGEQLPSQVSLVPSDSLWVRICWSTNIWPRICCTEAAAEKSWQITSDYFGLLCFL